MTDLYVQTRVVEPVVMIEPLSPPRSNTHSPSMTAGEWMLRKMRHIDSFIVQSISRLPSRSRPSSGMNSHPRQPPIPSRSSHPASSMIRVMRNEISRHLTSPSRLVSHADDQSNGILHGNSRSNANSSYLASGTSGTSRNGQTRILRAEIRAVSAISLENPIHQGYILSYCLLEYNAENMQFIIDVDRLQDLMSKQLTPVWTSKHWKEIDTDVNILERKDCDVGDCDYRLSLEKVSAILLSSSALTTRRDNDISTAQDTPPTESTDSEGSNDPSRRKESRNNDGNDNIVSTTADPIQLPQPQKQPQPPQPIILEISSTSIPIPSSSAPDPSPTPMIVITNDNNNNNNNNNNHHHNLGPNKISIEQEKRNNHNRWKNAWPQRHITKDAIDREINRIWKTYMDFDAPRQVCHHRIISYILRGPFLCTTE